MILGVQIFKLWICRRKSEIKKWELTRKAGHTASEMELNSRAVQRRC